MILRIYLQAVKSFAFHSPKRVNGSVDRRLLRSLSTKLLRSLFHCGGLPPPTPPAFIARTACVHAMHYGFVFLKRLCYFGRSGRLGFYCLNLAHAIVFSDRHTFPPTFPRTTKKPPRFSPSANPIHHKPCHLFPPQSPLSQAK